MYQTTNTFFGKADPICTVNRQQPEKHTIANLDRPARIFELFENNKL